MRELDNLKIDIFKLIIPKEKLNEICDFIKDSALESHKDFILFLIAKIEQVYVRDVEFYDRPDERKIIKEFPNEVKKLHKVLKLSENKTYEEDKNKPTLQEISFRYNIASPIKIKDKST